MNQIIARQFSLATRRALAARGVTILAALAVPDASGRCGDVDTAYGVDDNGTYRVLSFRSVRNLATGAAA